MGPRLPAILFCTLLVFAPAMADAAAHDRRAPPARHERGPDDGTMPPIPANPAVTDAVEDLYPGTDSVLARSPTLSWHKANGAARYHVQLADDADFHHTIIDRVTTDLSAGTGSLRPGKYYWRIGAIPQRGDRIQWSLVTDFELRSTADDRAKVTLHWRPGAWVAASYKIQIARDEKFATLTLEKSTDAAFCVTDLLPRGRYFWRVQMMDSDGKLVDTTPRRTFAIGDGGIVTQDE
jgi:hypothetical protein